MASTGNISAKVFIDGNQNGIEDEDDLPLPDIGFIINGSKRPQFTDASGTAFIPSMQAHREINISIAEATLEDPLWSSAFDGIHVIPRPGNTIELDFPIFLTGEIDGTVSLEKQGKIIGAGNVTIEIVDQKGHVITTTQTSYDGFYIISDIPVGHFRARIAEKHLKKLRVRGAKTQAIDISIDSRFINGIDFTLTR